MFGLPPLYQIAYEDEKMRRVIAILGVLWVAAGAARSADKETAVKIGQEEQLFLDDLVIQQTENITRRVNRAAKHGPPLIQRDRPWEHGKIYIFGSPIYDRGEKRFKIWYYCDGDVAYAISKNGLTWEKPELDVILRGGKKTNLVMERAKERGTRGPYGYLFELFSVIKDEHDPDPARRYKMGFLGINFKHDGTYPNQFHRGQRRGLCTAVSPDGIHWTQETEWASCDICDGLSSAIWDPLTKRFVCYGRTKMTPDRNDGRWTVHGWGRAVNRVESEDFRTWSKGELVFATDDKDPKGSEIYSLSVFPYEGIYVGLVQMFYALPDQLNLEMHLASSRDGKRFTRVEPRHAFLPESGIGEWDRWNISVGMLPLVVGDELWFYYSGRTRRHSPYKGRDTGPKVGCIGLAKIRRGRFLSLEASFDGGTILTKPLLFDAGEMFLNANAAYGSIQVELLDVEGKAIPDSKRLVRGENGIALHVPFRPNHLQKVKGKPVRIRFTLKNAQLYGFRVK